ncbi:MAG TPA: ketoacyl-ACP synthase III [Paludibacteraceae bacterium]|nr:ketoacyl-ACP synthase III [Paludibacteraceae bacterium]HOU68343.1 ketoacyl-ACP synthase III [Paludibacteraceae bacterium]HPH62931.1 ketoacyl-ACP synthase III [Paludibacteraceae bacterium]HQF50166.1 ketoacyl-ACP synthase III [Paludibacteraceae bacterium]
MRIIGTGVSIPELKVTNDMIAEFLDTNDEWISTRTGIKERRLISTKNLFHLAADAASKALESAGKKATDMDLIICSNVANSYVTPSLSSIVQGIIKATCPCFDINNACTGFLTGLDIADAYISSGKYKNILLICAEEPSRFCDWGDRNASILFGDAAGAVVLTEGEGLKKIITTTVSMTDVLYYRRKLEPSPFVKKDENYKALQMVGKEVFKTAVTSSTRDITRVISECGMVPSDIDLFILHQANLRINDSIRQHLDLPEEKFPHNLDKYGNTSSATIPLLLDEQLKAGKIKNGDILCFSAFGAGFSTGACIMKWNA